MDLDTAIKLINVGYKLGVILIGIAFIFGTLFYLGKKSKFNLEKKTSFTEKSTIVISGYIIFILLVFVFFSDSIVPDLEDTKFRPAAYLSITLFFNWATYKFLLKSWRLKGLDELFEILDLKRYNNKMPPWPVLKEYFVNPLLITTSIPIVLHFFFPEYIYRFLISFLSIFIFIELPPTLYKLGQLDNVFSSSGTPVSVITIEGKESLILFQTTDIDYRFLDGNGGEVIIPREEVKRIIYNPDYNKSE